ncbi:DEAD/DEAH box helicase family protein [Neobacillus drentensis]|uniref:DEAD/DEAH box helicase family protein n=1 Tax=Neobacillus drentensis TaxID=220684 RepID=UPI001F332A49|nr:DEAD/DEAH box helicase family protein [Neobacillus drentensis]ULT58706.1 DEAD/DEAH box helicase family protein [Neobacillus drentensis]
MLVKKPLKTKINIIDSIMGSGKTSWAIQYMNEAPRYKKFIYITPFLNEVERVLNAAEREFVRPENIKGKSKLDNLKKLILNGEDIVSTHALFQRFDNDLIELIEMQGYTLILDEVMNVIEQVKYTKDDIQVLLTAKTKTGESLITIDKNGFVQWNEKDYSEGNFTQIRNLAVVNNLMIFENTAMYWLLPVSAFKGFEEIFVLTYMFNGQLQRYYYDLFNLAYSFHSVTNVNDSYQLIDYIPLDKEDRSHLREMIKIYYSKPIDKVDLNKIGEGRYSFSVSHLKKIVENNELRQLIKNNGFNYYINKCKIPVDLVMWTTFKDFEKILSPKNLKKQFVEVTARATNDYVNKSTCIYFANRFMNPILKQFFLSKNVTVDEDLFALSELLQWIFRSRIRNGQPINLYIPSQRMRELLEEYLR